MDGTNSIRYSLTTGSLLALVLLLSASAARAQWSWDSLSKARFQPSVVTVGSKIMFAGGGKFSHVDDADSIVDIYDDSTGKWSKQYLSRARYNMAAAVSGNKVFFAGGETGTEYPEYLDVVDIYDNQTNKWSRAKLSVPRCELASAVTGSKVIFAGGLQGGRFTSSDIVDIYDTNTKRWSTHKLTVGRYRLASASLGSRAFFAGGIKERAGFTDVIDIYDDATATWSTHKLSEKRHDLIATTVGNKVLFAGGETNLGESSTVDIFDGATNTWSTYHLSSPRFDLAAVSCGSKAFFAGGHISSTNLTSDVVDIYDHETNTWTKTKLSEPRNSIGAGAVGSKVFFAGGWTNASKGPTRTIDIYSLESEKDTETPEIITTYKNDGRLNTNGKVEVEIIVTDASYLSSVKVNSEEKFNGQPLKIFTILTEFEPGEIITIEASDVLNLKYKMNQTVPIPVSTTSPNKKHTYYALLMAVEKYNDKTIVPLHEPIADATKLRSLLIQHYSFDEANITFLKDPTSSDMQEAFSRLRTVVTPDDLLLIFYAGHGVYESAANIGYWLPSDATNNSRVQWYRNSALVEDIRAIKSMHTLLIADACFAGAILTSRGVSNNASATIANMMRRPSRKAMTSGDLTTVPDQSDFVKYLTKVLEENQNRYLTTEDLYHDVRERMKNNSELAPVYGEIKGTGDEGGSFVFEKRGPN